MRRRLKRSKERAAAKKTDLLPKLDNDSSVLKQNDSILAQNNDIEPLTAKTEPVPKRNRRRQKSNIQQKKAESNEAIPVNEPLQLAEQPQKSLPEDNIPKELETLDDRTSAQQEVNNREIDDTIDEEDTIEFYFENTDLQNVVTQIGQLYNVTFITDDIITPIAAGNRALKGNKLSFKTHKPLTKQDGWNLFLTFLDIAGFAVVPDSDPKIFRITMVQKAQRAAIPSFIGVDSQTLPDNDQMIRYVYFIENIDPTTLKGIVEQMLSSSAGQTIILPQLKALILTDKSYNIKTLMKIVKELDKVSMPQSMSVLKLTRADAEEVAKLYAAIIGADENVMSRIFPARKQPTALYFPENVRVIPEKRSNSLILLGPRDAIEKIEDFVGKFIDVDPDKPYSPLHTYQLQYAQAKDVASIMTDVLKFGAETQVGKVGGVRGGDKYFKPMLFIPEPATNQLIIRGEYQDYLKAVEVIKQLDEPQVQVALEVLILTVELKSGKEIGAQLRSKNNGVPCGILGSNATFQTGNLGQGIQTRNPEGQTVPGCQKLLGNLLDLVKKIPAPSTVVSLGCDAFGVWGIFKALETITNSEVISNPFVLTTNKTAAHIEAGEIRRLKTAVVKGATDTPTYGDETAALRVDITPQINSDGMIVLDIIVDIKQFLEGTTTEEAARTHRRIDTKTTVADDEVIALGGLIRNKIEDNTAKTPFFGDIPGLGWLFKNRKKEEDKGNLLILVSAKIINPGSEEGITRFTNKHIDDYYGALGQMYDIGQKKDPITRLFFEDSTKDVARRVEDLLFKDRNAKHKKRRKRGKKELQQGLSKPLMVQTEPNNFQQKNPEKNRSIVKREQILAKRKDRHSVLLTDLGTESEGTVS